jgi:rhamnulokinase
MSKNLKMLAFDFGASSGRAILGQFDGEKLTTEEIHRFSNDPVEVRGSLYWDTLRLFHEIKHGILKCMNSGHKDIASIAIDTWGVDFGLLDENGNLLGNPFHYRDIRTDGMMEEVFKIMPKDEVYLKTGIQFMKLNTIFQLFAMRYHCSPLFKLTKTLLFTPDLFNYFLTGVKTTEYSIASTSQLLDAEKGNWSEDLLNRLGLPGDIFTEIVPSGTVVGKLLPEIAKELGAGEVSVIATAAHDTASAVAAVPAIDEDYVYISCGTWSLMGVESDTPIINEKSYAHTFTNEGGVSGKIRFLKNIMGLWLIQESKRQWEREGDQSTFADLETAAWEAKPFVSFIDPDDDSFITPGDMPNKIRNYCQKTNQPVPETKGEVIRCIAQSLALKYRLTVENLEGILGKKLPVVHMVGGGIKDKMLCQFTANATARQVIAGPVEATAIGNLMVQAMALGAVRDLREIRQVVKNSFPAVEYIPQATAAWDEAYEGFRRIVG